MTDIEILEELEDLCNAQLDPDRRMYCKFRVGFHDEATKPTDMQFSVRASECGGDKPIQVIAWSKRIAENSPKSIIEDTKAFIEQWRDKIELRTHTIFKE